MTESKPSRRAVVFLVAGSLLIAAVAAEVVVRLAGYRPALLEPDMFVALDDDLCPFGLKPGWDGYYCGKRVTVDERGYRTVRSDVPNPARAKEASPKAVLLLGDSVVFGQGVEDHETFASRLQQRYDRERAALRVENIAVPAYSTWNEVGALRRYFADGGRADQVLVLWVANDPTEGLDPLGIRSGEFRQMGDGFFHRTVGWTYRRWYTSYLAADAMKRLMGRRQAPEAVVGTDRRLLARSLEGLAAMHMESRGRGAGLLVGIYCDRPMLDAAGQPSAPTLRLLEQIRATGVSAFLVLSHHREVPPEEATVSWSDPHPSHRAILSATGDLFRELERAEGLTPEQAGAVSRSQGMSGTGTSAASGLTSGSGGS